MPNWMWMLKQDGLKSCYKHSCCWFRLKTRELSIVSYIMIKYSKYCGMDLALSTMLTFREFLQILMYDQQNVSAFCEKYFPHRHCATIEASTAKKIFCRKWGDKTVDHKNTLLINILFTVYIINEYQISPFYNHMLQHCITPRYWSAAYFFRTLGIHWNAIIYSAW